MSTTIQTTKRDSKGRVILPDPCGHGGDVFAVERVGADEFILRRMRPVSSDANTVSKVKRVGKLLLPVIGKGRIQDSTRIPREERFGYKQ